MTKLQIVILIATLALTVATSQKRTPAKHLSSRLITRPRTRVLARQELVTDADVSVTPYPSADELKPKVPFDEAPEVPVEVEQVPDEFYGPPDLKDNHIPDEIYGPPELWLPANEASLSFEQQARLVTARRSAALQQRKLQAKLQDYRQLAAAKHSYVRPAKLKIIGVKSCA